MLKKRLIFTLLWNEGSYCLSRNFLLQEVGDLAWLDRHYNFKVIALAIDELVVLNTNRDDKETARFAAEVNELVRGCFVPVAAGGGIRTSEDAHLLLRSGADKVVVNTPLFEQPDLVRELARTYGAQCVVASIDYRTTGGNAQVVTHNGSKKVELSLTDAIAHAESVGAGEILLTSIDKDGTGQGYDMTTLEQAVRSARVPVIASGGVGDFEHLAQWLAKPEGAAASTANIFNFLGRGLIEARAHLRERGIALASWPEKMEG